MKLRFTFGLLLIAACPFAQSQVAPAATAGRADLRYAVRYSETANFTGPLGAWHTIDTSGSLDYTNGRINRPFRLDYTGGYLSTLSGPAYAEGAFQRLSISQGIDWRKWMVDFSDDVGYRPQAPTTGFSGIPGTGEPIGADSNPSSQLILTVNTHTLDNNASGRLQHIFNHHLVLNVNAAHILLWFPDGNGLDTDQLMIGGGPSFRIDARNSFIARCAFSRFNYSGHGFQTNTVSVGYDKTWNRAFQSNISVGPEWVQATSSFAGSTGVAAQAVVNYQARRYSASLSYDRGTTTGSGYLLGAKSDSVVAGLSRAFTQTFTFELAGGYRRTSDLATQGNIAGEYGSVQASWRLGRLVNAFVNYTAISQSASAQVPSNVLNQLLQTASFGMSFSKQLKAAK